MNYEYYYQNHPEEYLMHYGVKGMKWGHRKSQAVIDARSAYRSAKKDYNKAYNKASGYSSRHAIGQFVSKKHKAESDRRWDDAINKAGAVNKAKDAYKQAKAADKAQRKQATKNAVKEYSKKYDIASNKSDIADKKWSKVSEQYKALGKNKVERMINAAKNKSSAAKAYNKSYDDWERSQNAADKAWDDAKNARKGTGRNAISRTVNTARYS